MCAESESSTRSFLVLQSIRKERLARTPQASQFCRASVPPRFQVNLLVSKGVSGSSNVADNMLPQTIENRDLDGCKAVLSVLANPNVSATDGRPVLIIAASYGYSNPRNPLHLGSIQSRRVYDTIRQAKYLHSVTF